MKLQKPKNDNAEVLRALITKGKVNCIMFSFMEGYRSRLSNLRLKYKIPLDYKVKEKINRHGHKMRFREHFIKPGKTDYAIGVYLKINE